MPDCVCGPDHDCRSEGCDEQCPACSDAIDFTCECVEVDGSALERAIYVVTSHEGDVARCAYCEGCADLAEMDWTGETAAIEVVR